MPGPTTFESWSSIKASSEMGRKRSASIMSVASLVDSYDDSSDSDASITPSSSPQQFARASPPGSSTSSAATSTTSSSTKDLQTVTSSAPTSVSLPFMLPPRRFNNALLLRDNLEKHLCKHNLELAGITLDWKVIMAQLPTDWYEETAGTKKLFNALHAGSTIPSETSLLRKGDLGRITHLLAVVPSHGTSPCESHVLLPIHAFIYAVQCVALPTLPPSHDPEATAEDIQLTVPIVKVAVPAPDAFITLHRFLYTRSSSDLLHALLPMRYISSHWSRASRATAYGLASRQADGAVAAITTAAEIASHLSLPTILHHIRLISKAWCNAHAIGLLDPRFWSVLDRAYQVIIGAYLTHRKILDQQEYDRLRKKGIAHRRGGTFVHLAK